MRRTWTFIRVSCDSSSNFWLWLICEGSEGHNASLIIILGISHSATGCRGVRKGRISAAITEPLASHVTSNWATWRIFCGVSRRVRWIRREGHVAGLWINEVLVDLGGGNWGSSWCVRFRGRAGSIGTVCVPGSSRIPLLKLLTLWIGWAIRSPILRVNDWLCRTVE